MFITRVIDQRVHDIRRNAMLYLFDTNRELPTMPETSYYRTLVQQADDSLWLPKPQGYQTALGRAFLINMLQVPEKPYQYHTFSIPKKSGGFRVIKAPEPKLKQTQAQAIRFLLYQDNYNYPCVHPHDSAYAYIKNRSAYHALQRHQENNSRWFLKLDLKDFFPSCTKEWLEDTLKSIHPIRDTDPELMQQLLELFTDEGALPQGAPSSPALSNLCMLPVDKELAHMLHSKGFIYTRYADDLLISHQYDFNFQEIVELIKQILEPTPFQLNHSKTRYGSRAGQNWNLGLMLNKENKITIGHKRKERLRVSLYRFMSDPQAWSLEDRQHLAGTLSYFEQIEPEYKKQMVQKYEQKFNVSLKDLL